MAGERAGFVDLHLHLLPGLDDGCKTMDDALAMAKALVALGYVAAAPSPHNRPEYASGSKQASLAKLEEVRAALAGAGLSLGVDENAENYFLDERLLGALPTPESRRLGKAGRYLLAEAPYSGPVPTLPDLLFRIKLKGVTPLIAHPERCFEFEKPGRAAECVRGGALLQLDLGSLTGKYGKTALRLARQFLGEGLYAVAATDLHSPVNAEAWVGESLAALERAVGAKAFRALVAENPAALLRGDAPP